MMILIDVDYEPDDHTIMAMSWLLRLTSVQTCGILIMHHLQIMHYITSAISIAISMTVALSGGASRLPDGFLFDYYILRRRCAHLIAHLTPDISLN